jgi:microcompartment protein CcmK/EutM
MILGRVVGRLVATLKHAGYEGSKLLLVRPIGVDGIIKNAPVIVAIDSAEAGPGDTVLVNQEGKAARSIMGNNNVPARSVIVAVVDHWMENGSRHEAESR